MIEETFTAVTPNQLGAIRRFIEDVASQLGCDPETSADLIVAVNEATTNIITHGYGDAAGDINVRVAFQQQKLVVTLTDSAPPFDPTQAPPPDLTIPPHRRKPGGLGIEMMREFADTFRYRRLENEQNQLVLEKGAPNGNDS